MSVIVADTSPLNYLILIGAVDVLPALYGRVLIPEEVLVELTDRRAPEAVLRWASILPDWLDVRNVTSVYDESLKEVDAGERAAIALAQLERDALLLIDDASGRAAAVSRGIATTGTLGVLEAAHKENLIEFREALERLRETNFRVSRSLIEALLARFA